MKKIFLVLITLTLAASLTVTAFAADTAENTDNTSIGEPITDTDVATDADSSEKAEILPDTDITEDEGTIPPLDVENADTEAENTAPEAFYDGWIDKITDSTMWVNVGTSLLAALGTIAFVISKFGALTELLKGKADGTTILGAIKDSAKETNDKFSKNLESLNKKLDSYEDNEKKLWAILTIFMTHAKISSAAKGEIMELLTGIKDMSGSIAEIVEKASCAIEKAEAETAAAAPAHPALEAIIAKSAESTGNGDYMEL